MIFSFSNHHSGAFASYDDILFAEVTLALKKVFKWLPFTAAS
jgi:hypothetical protein